MTEKYINYRPLWRLFRVFGLVAVGATRKNIHGPGRSSTEQADLVLENRRLRQVAHDIRSPLSALKILLLKPDMVSDEVRNIAEAAIQRIEQTTSGLLDEDGCAAVHHESIDQCEVLHRAVRLKRIEFGDHKGLSINVEAPVGFRLQTGLANHMLENILSNLMNNSLEASGRRCCLRIQLRCGYQNDVIYIDIEDQGPGFSNAALRALEKGLPVVTEKASGHGLGLSMARELVQQSGGKMQFKNLPSGGAQVRLMWGRGSKGLVD